MQAWPKHGPLGELALASQAENSPQTYAQHHSKEPGWLTAGSGKSTRPSTISTKPSM
jgi:hypothetical protein